MRELQKRNRQRRTKENEVKKKINRKKKRYENNSEHCLEGSIQGEVKKPRYDMD